MLRSVVIVVLLWVAAGSACAQSQPTSRFEGWAAGIIAADWRTSAGEPIQAFDNARRDLTQGFLAAGFTREHTVDYSLRPDVGAPTTADQAIAGVYGATGQAQAGCLLYFTSHGGPAGMVLGLLLGRAGVKYGDAGAGLVSGQADRGRGLRLLLGHLRRRPVGSEPDDHDSGAARPVVVRL